MSNILDTLLTVIIGSISDAARTISDGVSVLQDFCYVKVSGMSFIVLGARQTGKTTLIEWLRGNMASIEGFEPDPTTAGGEVVPDFNTRIGDTFVKLKPNRDVGGEYAMWETDWLELFRTAQPRGIIFLIDHTDVHLQKDALNFVMQMIDDEREASQNLKAFYILVNKSDLWGEEATLDDIMHHYRNEQRRLKAQAERLHFQWSVSEGSLVTGRGVRSMMQSFFNAIRPRPHQ
ncbi:MAG: GTPase domain-containing protein [Anaerolineae bacterium]|nr:GTPase domain-containing protein [Anaerolineae bacterium]